MTASPSLQTLTASELGPMIGASETTLLRLADLGVVRLKSPGGEFMAWHMEPTFVIAEGEVERLRERVAAMRAEGRLPW